jgi:hypothetical protein
MTSARRLRGMGGSRYRQALLGKHNCQLTI